MTDYPNSFLVNPRIKDWSLSVLYVHYVKLYATCTVYILFCDLARINV